MKKTTLIFAILIIFCPVIQPQVSAQSTGEVRKPGSHTQKPLFVQNDHLQAGIDHFLEGEYEEALERLTKSRNENPESPLAAYYLGMTYKKMEDPENAEEHLKDAVTLQPAVKEAFVELADVYYTQGRNDEALHAIKVAERENIEPAQTKFLRGLVQIAKRNYRDALASFEGARDLDPGLASAVDLQIAKIHSLAGRNAEATAIYESLIKREPDSDIGDMARQQMEALRRQPEGKQRFYANVDLQYHYDTNVILQPDSGPTITTSREDDTAAVFTARLGYSPALPVPFETKLEYGFYLSKYSDLSEYDVRSHSLTATPSYRIGQNKAQMQVSWNYTLVDNAKYVQSVLLSPQYAFVTGADHYTQASVWYQKNDFRNNPVPEENRSGNNLGTGISWVRIIADKQGFLNFRYELNKDDTDGANWSYLGNRFTASALYPVLVKVNLLGNLEIFFQDFSNTHTAFGVKRSDASYTANIQGIYAFTKTIDAHVQYTYVNNDSNVPVYGYSKNIVGAGVFARF